MIHADMISFNDSSPYTDYYYVSTLILPVRTRHLGYYDVTCDRSQNLHLLRGGLCKSVFGRRFCLIAFIALIAFLQSFYHMMFVTPVVRVCVLSPPAEARRRPPAPEHRHTRLESAAAPPSAEPCIYGLFCHQPRLQHASLHLHLYCLRHLH